MPRKLGKDVRNELKIVDPISGSIIKLYYRLPTSEDRVKYASDHYEWVEGKIQVNTIKARQKWGLEILEGFEEGSFEKKVDDQWKGFSSDPQSPNHDPNWKTILSENAMDLIEALAEYVFEGRRIIGLQEDIFTEKN
jgi:hypothetical protein